MEQKEQILNCLLTCCLWDNMQPVDCVMQGGEMEAPCVEKKTANSGSYLSEPLVKLHGGAIVLKGIDAFSGSLD